MEKYNKTNKKSKKTYNSDKTFVQISKNLHIKIKEHCQNKNIKLKDFIEESIKKNLINS